MSQFTTLNSKIFNLTKRRVIPGVVIDVLNTRCSVRLSQRGAVLKNIPFSGRIPKKGDQISVDYSRGVPVAITSDDGGNTSDVVTATEKPIATASQATGTSSLETTPPRAGGLYYRNDWASTVDYVINDLVTHEDVLYLAIENNINQEPPNETYWMVFSSGGGSLPTLDGKRVLVTDADGNIVVVDGLVYDPATNSIVIGGDETIFPSSQANKLTFIGDGDSIGIFEIVLSDELSDSGFDATIRGGGTLDAPTKVKDGMVIKRVRGRGLFTDSLGSISETQAEILFKAVGDWSETNQATKIEFYVTPEGTQTQVLAMTIMPDGNVNIASGKQYQVNGVQHTHGAPSLASSVVFLGSTFTVTTPSVYTSRSYEATGLKITLPEAGTYRVTLNLWLNFQTNGVASYSWLNGKIRNNTTGLDVTNTEFSSVVVGSGVTTIVSTLLPLQIDITTSGAEELEVYLGAIYIGTAPTWTQKEMTSSGDGKSSIAYLRTG